MAGHRRRSSKVGAQEFTAQPELLQVGHFVRAKAVEFMESKTADERFRGLPEQVGGNTAQHENSAGSSDH